MQHHIPQIGQVAQEQQQQQQEEEQGNNLDDDGFENLDQMIDEDDDEDNNMGDLNVAMDELLGLRGPGWVLFHNVLWLLTFNGLYLCVALFAPTTVGAVVISLLSKAIESVSETTFGFKINPLDAQDEAFLLRTLHVLRAQEQVEEVQREKFVEARYGPWHQHFLSSIESPSPKVCLVGEETSEGKRMFFNEFHWVWLEVQAVLVGYITIAWLLAVIYYCAKHLRDSAVSASARRTYQSVTRVFKLMSRTFKVVVIVFLKMGVFPVLLGVLLEQAGNELVILPIDQFEFATEHPVFAAMTLWVAGITHMLVITVIVLELRDVLHPDILHGIIRAKDADESLLRNVLEDPISKHVRRMAVSCAIYTVLVFAFIYAPTMAFKATRWGHNLPYHVTMNYVVLELHLPLELMCIHIGVLNLLDQGKDAIRAGIEMWFGFFANLLGLSEFLLPIKKDSAATENAAAAENAENAENNAAENAAALDADASLRAMLKPRVTPSLWFPRVLVIVFFMWLSALIMTAAVAIIPLYVGQATVNLLQLPFVHEPLIYSVGVAVIWRSATAALALKLHRAPTVLFKYVINLVQQDAQAPDHARFRTQLRWTTFAALALLSPWLLGMILQLAVLLPASHPSLNNFNDSSYGSFPQQMHALLVALSGNAPQVDAQQVCDNPSLNKFVGDGSDRMTKAAALADSMAIYSAPLHDWLVRLVMQVVLVNLLMHADIMQVRPFLHSLHTSFMEAVDAITKQYDCRAMLDGFLLPLCKAQVAALLIPLLLPAIADILLVTATGGHSLFAHEGIVSVYRQSSALILAAMALPSLAREAEKVWVATHSTLRDERYLIGKRLHNMESRQI